MSSYYTPLDHFTLLPALMLALFGCAILLFDFLVFHRPEHRKWLLVATLVGLAMTAIALLRQELFLSNSGQQQVLGFGGSLILDRFALFFNWMFLAATALVALISYRVLQVEREPMGEYFGLLLLANCGMYFLAAGAELITLVMGLE